MSDELSGALPFLKPKFRFIIKDLFLTVRGFFIPFFMMGICLTLSAAAIAITVLIMAVLEKLPTVDTESLHSVVVAIITGIAASGFVSIVIEGGNNYRWNQRRQLILSDYLRAVSGYEFNIQSKCTRPLICVCQYHHIKLDETKFHSLSGSLLDEEEFDEEDDEEPELPNRFMMLAEEYAEIYPLLREAYANSKEYLKQCEIDALEQIFKADQTIRDIYSQELYCLCLRQQTEEPEQTQQPALHKLLPGKLRHYASEVLHSLCHKRQSESPEQTQWPVLHNLFSDSLKYDASEIALKQEIAHFVDSMMQHTDLQEKVHKTLLKGVDISIQQLYGGTADENWEEHGGYNMLTDTLLEALHLLEGMSEEGICTEEQREKNQQRHRQFISRRLSEAYQEIDVYLSALRRETLKEPCYWIKGKFTQSVLDQNLYCLQEIQNQCQEEPKEEGVEKPSAKEA